MQNWYLIYTKPKKEEMLATSLLDNGFEVLNPKIKMRSIIRGIPRYSVSPLFPCYIFVMMNVSRDYHFVNYTRGVRKIVGTGSVPTVVSWDIIRSLQILMTDGFVAIKPREFDHGERVCITGGHFRGLDAVFEKELKGSERVLILLKAINAHVIIDRALIAREN